VVTYETIVDFDNPERKLFPGMTAYVWIPIQSAKNVLSISNASIRFNPNMSRGEISALLDQYGIDPNEVAQEQSNPNASNGGTAKTILWKAIPQKGVVPILVVTGVTDHTSTEIKQVLKGTLDAGDRIAIAEQSKPMGFGR
jgi:hypothetical protein